MATQITGNWLYPSAQPVANGTLYLKLSQSCQVSGGNSQVVAGETYTIPLTTLGFIPNSTTVFGNDGLVPAGSSYRVTVNDAGGGRLYGPFTVTITGSTFNFNTYTPTP